MTTATAPSRWLFGARTDLLLGAGLIYVPVFLLLLSDFGKRVEEYFPLALTPLLALLLSVPHYGATLLRVYESREEQQKYRVFSIYLTAVIWGWFAMGVYNSLAASLLITLYFIWSPWHYMGQNYGVALMFLSRNGISVSAGLKRLIHLSFLSSFFLAAVELMSLPGSGGFFRMLSLELPGSIRDSLFIVLGTVYVASTFYVLARLRRQATPEALAPAVLVMFSQALWFLVPLVAIRFGLFQNSVALSAGYTTYAFFWIAMTHAIQYLWVTSYFAKNKPAAQPVSVYLFRALLAGALVWVLPALLFAPGVLGHKTYDAGFSILIAATVNVHHFVLDGAIWKLRNGPIARILIKSVNAAMNPTSQNTMGLFSRAFVVFGIVCVFVQSAATTQTVRAYDAVKAGDGQQASSIVDSLVWMGRDSAELESKTGLALAKQGYHEQALRHGKAAVRLEQSIQTWSHLSVIEELAGHVKESLNAAEAAVALNPDSVPAQRRLAYLRRLPDTSVRNAPDR